MEEVRSELSPSIINFYVSFPVSLFFITMAVNSSVVVMSFGFLISDVVLSLSGSMWMLSWVSVGCRDVVISIVLRVNPVVVVSSFRAGMIENRAARGSMTWLGR